MRLRAGSLACAIALFALAGSAHAEDKKIEAAAKDALKKVGADYAAKQFDEAVARLEKAIQVCGSSKCTPGTKSMLYRDLGVMQLRKGDKEAAEVAFVEALELEPHLELNPNYDAPDLKAEWDAAKDEASATKAGQPSGDFSHVPAAAQAVRTPLPVFVEYAGSTPIDSVIVRYKGPGMSEYKRVSLTKSGKGWGGLIPCADVKRGIVRYYVQGFSSDGSPIAGSGSAREPYFVPIRAKISGTAPSLPGSPAPKTCDASTGGGDEPKGTDTSDEPSGEPTPTKLEPKEDGGYARVWIGVSGSIDFIALPAANDVCKLTSGALPLTGGYYCTNPDGTDFPSRSGPTENATLTKSNSGAAPGGLTGRDIRVMLSFDYAISPNLLAGARFGYVLNSYPGTAASKDGHAFSMPLHFELRATYLFGDAPLAHSGFAPYAFAGAGATELDAPSTVQVTQTGIAGQSPKVAWITSGPLFFSLGLGARYAFSPRVAFNAGARFMGAFGGGGGFLPAYAPEVGLAYGF